MNYTVKLIKFNHPGTKLKPKGVVVHETGNPGGTAQNHFDYWNAKNRGSSVQAVVDWNEVIQLIPYNEVSWHAGRTANLSMIGVELCRPAEYDEAKFNAVWDTAVKLFADIFIEQVGVTTVTKDNLMSHAEVSEKWHETNHQDPISYFAEYNKTVDDFRWAVQQRINELKGPQLNTTLWHCKWLFVYILWYNKYYPKIQCFNRSIYRGLHCAKRKCSAYPAV